MKTPTPSNARKRPAKWRLHTTRRPTPGARSVRAPCFWLRTAFGGSALIQAPRKSQKPARATQISGLAGTRLHQHRRKPKSRRPREPNGARKVPKNMHGPHTFALLEECRRVRILILQPNPAARRPRGRVFSRIRFGAGFQVFFDIGFPVGPRRTHRLCFVGQTIFPQ